VIDAHHAHIKAEGTLDERRRRNLRKEVLGLATARLRRKLERSIFGDEEVAELMDRVVRREIDPATAAARLLERRGRNGSRSGKSARQLGEDC
jgi:LAO/AO transport system kinase